MILVIGDNSMLTLSYALTKLLYKSTDQYSSFEVFAARTVSQMLCQEIYNYFVNRKQQKQVDPAVE